jgi:hypothetical protein
VAETETKLIGPLFYLQKSAPPNDRPKLNRQPYYPVVSLLFGGHCSFSALRMSNDKSLVLGIRGEHVE